ncbi:hypothetical protein DNTS_025236 [Danionella cerebrum]|uniref:Uncharacterized protein n=1 Tax=Danionella cerebrum TaxID=2873325 RepID=A0A553QRW9_9TELE|nr:hypothetical protein DNTS_025236 [Danionella translucida]
MFYSSDDEHCELSRPSLPEQETPKQAAPSTVQSGETNDTFTPSSEQGVASTSHLEVASQTGSEDEYLPSKRARRQPPKSSLMYTKCVDPCCTGSYSRWAPEGNLQEQERGEENSTTCSYCTCACCSGFQRLLEKF